MVGKIPKKVQTNKAQSLGNKLSAKKTNKENGTKSASKNKSSHFVHSEAPKKAPKMDKSVKHPMFTMTMGPIMLEKDATFSVDGKDIDVQLFMVSTKDAKKVDDDEYFQLTPEKFDLPDADGQSFFISADAAEKCGFLPKGTLTMGPMMLQKEGNLTINGKEEKLTIYMADAKEADKVDNGEYFRLTADKFDIPEGGEDAYFISNKDAEKLGLMPKVQITMGELMYTEPDVELSINGLHGGITTSANLYHQDIGEKYDKKEYVALKPEEWPDLQNDQQWLVDRETMERLLDEGAPPNAFIDE